MQSYDDALKIILNEGVGRTNKRTKIKTLSIFGMLNRYRLDTEYFPILTRRKVWPKSVFSELLWFLSGSTSNKDLKNLGCNFWTPWVDDEFEKKHGFQEETFGPVYGFQLRHFGGDYNKGNHESPFYGQGGFDQLKWVVERIKEDHSCRRTLWTLWNPQDVDKMRLPPCHMMYQVLVDDDRKLTGILYQRSCDFPIGVPANIQFYSALTIMLAQQTGCNPFEFVHVTADSHIYENQIEGVELYLKTDKIDSPKIKINKAEDIFSYKPEDFVVEDFKSGPKIEIPVAV
jgi:thymidylate synthase